MAKRAISCLLSVLMLLSILSGCSVRKADAAPDESRPASQDNTGTKQNGEKKPGKKTKAEASGSDLMIPEPADEGAAASLNTLRQTIAESGCVCGMAFLAYINPENSIPEAIEQLGVLSESGYAAAYPFMTEMLPGQCAALPFSELYCLVPGEEIAEVRIEERETEDGEATNTLRSVLYSAASCVPVFFAMESNGWGGSNVVITLKKADGTELSFNPGILCNLGTLDPKACVYDFSLGSALEMPAG